MHYLVIDTCVWGDLFDKEPTLATKLSHLIEQSKVTIVLPELIVSEWDGIKNKITNQLIKKLSEISASYEKLRSLAKEVGEGVNEDKFIHSDLANKIVIQRIALLDSIIKSDKTILLPISPATKSLAIEYALEKKAPFRSKNGMADALIFFSAIEWADTNPEKIKYFVSSNVADFSNKEGGDINSLSPDLAKSIEKNGLKFLPVLARLLNEIESSLITEEEITDGDLVVKAVRIKDEIFDSMSKYNLSLMEEILRQQKIADELVPKGIMAEILEQQRIVDELIPKGAMAEILEQQRIADQLSPKWAMAEILAQQKIVDELIPKGAMAEILEQQRIADQLSPKWAMAEILEQQRIVDELIPKGAIAEILEQQRIADELASKEVFSISQQLKALHGSLGEWRGLLEPLSEYRESLSFISDFANRAIYQESIAAWRGISEPMANVREMISSNLPANYADVIGSIVSEIEGSSGLNYLKSIAFDVGHDLTVSDDGYISFASKQIAVQELQTLSQQIIADTALGDSSSLEDSINNLIAEIRAQKDPLIQKILIWLLYPIIVGVILSIVNPISEHYVSSYFKYDKRMQEKKLKSMAKNVVSDLDALRSIRYVGADHLNVRAKPSQQSESIGVLKFASAVIVLERRKSWTLVEWRDVENNTSIQGWVFSRYLKKFNLQ